MADDKLYIPALKYNWLTKFYDFLIQTFLKEQVWKTFLVRSISNKHHEQILDIGTGTGTLAIMLKKAYPSAKVAGLDGDTKILAIAEAKAQQSNNDVELIKGMSYDLPFPDNHFDVVTSSLMIHHLTDEDKVRTFKEVLRVLKPGGEFCIADWGKPKDRFSRLLFYWVQFLDGFKTTNSSVKGLVPAMLLQSGFGAVSELNHFRTIGGTISINKAVKL
ncbi:class I SAM-dependent methyltransferase [Flavihumibacter sediminis]|nr:class I SAM-dependent methyltransferase [Flavihumibacter sediminis]